MNKKKYFEVIDLKQLYIKKTKNFGSIVKFGVQYGMSLSILYNCKDIYEPCNYSIKIYLLDIFKDFPFFNKNYLKNSIVVDIKIN